MKKIQKHILALVLLLCSTVTMAAAQWCSGKLTDLWMDKNGVAFVFTSWRNQYVQVCNINQTVDGVTPANCATWISLIRNAVTNNADTIIYYADAPSCASVPIYGAAPIPYYVMLRN